MRKTIIVAASVEAQWNQVPFREGYISGVEATIDASVEILDFLSSDGITPLQSRRRNSWRDA